jgi:hypothetical protein
MRQFVFLLGLWLTLAACASGRKISDYKFVYRFQLDNQKDMSKVSHDSVDNKVKILNMGQLEPSWYNINSKIELTDFEIEKIKTCVASDKKDVTKCKKKNVYYVTIEI